MIILAIETSCDETAIALIKFKDFRFEILSNFVSSQAKIHQKWGGVVPTLAKREHQKNLTPVFKKVFRETGMLKKLPLGKTKISYKSNKKLKEILIREKHLYRELEKFLLEYQKPKIDLIAVTIGPGLEPALWMGVNFAKAISFFWNLSIVPVNHIEGHIFANFIGKEFKISDKSFFPLVCLSVAGGHTQLILMDDYGKYRLLGETRDDTAGECLDKIARMLKLGYPGGPIIAKLAKEGDPKTFSFPRPMMHTKDYDFSFSGLKTAVLYFLKKHNKRITVKYKNNVCASVQQAVIDVLIKKTIKAAQEFQAKTVIISGGVAANYELRRQLKEAIKKKLPNVQFLTPDTKFCTDNAAMVAVAAYFKQKSSRRKDWSEIKVNANLKIGEANL